MPSESIHGVADAHDSHPGKDAPLSQAPLPPAGMQRNLLDSIVFGQAIAGSTGSVASPSPVASASPAAAAIAGDASPGRCLPDIHSFGADEPLEQPLALVVPGGFGFGVEPSQRLAASGLAVEAGNQAIAQGERRVDLGNASLPGGGVWAVTGSDASARSPLQNLKADSLGLPAQESVAIQRLEPHSSKVASEGRAKPPVEFPAPRMEPNRQAAEHQWMLRELDAGSVLASVRDAHLRRDQSLDVARQLARALMSLGYARVQVVVNGQQERLLPGAQPEPGDDHPLRGINIANPPG